MSLANLDLDSALTEVQRRHAVSNPESERLHQLALASMPGGNSRTTLHYDPFPVTIQRGEGARVFDADDHEYSDFIGEYTAGLFGHSHPIIRETIESVLAAGHVLCGPNEHETALADIMCERFPAVERVRFTNSGTEANLMIVGVARHTTGREAVMVFNGGYHGAVFLFAGGGSPVNAPFPFVVAEYNNIEATREVLRREAHRLAVVLIEPVMGTAGAIPADPEFLAMLREECTEHGIVLSFDEVMTSRLSSGGAQALFGVTPDMTAFGKYIGGGLTVGAFGGRADIMDQFDPRTPGALPHAGTFNNNVLTMAAGVAGLGRIYTAEVADAHNRRGDEFRERLNVIAARCDVPAQVTGMGSMLGFHFHDGPTRGPTDSARTPAAARALFHLDMMHRGYYTGRTGLSSLCLPLEPPDFDGFEVAWAEFLEEFAPQLRAMR